MAKRQEKSNFSVTCGLLSQYIKEKCSLADLGLGTSTCVLNSVPSGKLEPSAVVASGAATLVVDAQSSSATVKRLASFQARAQPKFTDLPIARKASLHRFLEKRKDRINAKAPYQLSNNGGSKNVVTMKEGMTGQPWLGIN